MEPPPTQDHAGSAALAALCSDTVMTAVFRQLDSLARKHLRSASSDLRGAVDRQLTGLQLGINNAAEASAIVELHGFVQRGTLPRRVSLLGKTGNEGGWIGVAESCR
jgi:hypothetical protein